MKEDFKGVIVSLLRIGSILCITISLVFAQAPDTLWTQTYGGPNNDEAFSIQETMDGGYIITGYTEDFGGGLRNVWLLKTDTNGDTTWTNTYGGTGWHFGNCVQQTSDSGYIIVGGTSDLTLVADVFLIKTDTDGDTLWTKTFGGAEYDEGNCVQETSDGGYIIVGMTESYGTGSADLYLIKTNADGDSLWVKTYGGVLWDEGYSIQETADSGFIIAGYTTLSSGPGGPDTDVYLLKTDAHGDSAWAQTYKLNVAEEYRDYGYSVQQTSDDGYIIAGETWYPGMPAWEIDIYLIKTNANGDTMWTRTYDRSQNTDVGRSVQQTDDGGYIIAGYTQIVGIDYDIYIIRIDANGDTSWTMTIGDYQAPTPWEEAWAVDQTSDGGYIIAGWTLSYGAGGRDIWLIKTEPDVGIEEYELSQNIVTNLQIRPNPFSKVTDIRWQIPQVVDSRQKSVVSMKIYDATGRLVKQFNQLMPYTSTHAQSGGANHQSSINQIVWDATDDKGRPLPSGVYFLHLRVGKSNVTEKLLLIR